MPPNGGNPDLTEQDIRDVIAYIRKEFGKEVETDKGKGTGNEQAADIHRILQNYLVIQRALANDSIKEIPAAAKKITATAKVSKNTKAIYKASRRLVKADDIKSARKGFRKLSDSLLGYIAKHGVDSGIYYAIACPKLKLTWLQTDKKVRNPFYGHARLDCGSVSQTFKGDHTTNAGQKLPRKHKPK